MTLREYIIFWQETYDKSQSRPTTYAAHHYVFKNHILPGLGDIPLADLTSIVNDMIIAPNTINGERRNKRSTRLTPVWIWLISLVIRVSSVDVPIVSISL